MLRAEQGDILKVASIQYPLVVVSKNFFCGSEQATPKRPDMFTANNCESLT